MFFAVLASVLPAIVVHRRFGFPARPAVRSACSGRSPWRSLLAPLTLLLDPVWLRYVVAAALAFAPIFFANLVFAYSFRDTKTADMAFASNLLGAVVGGAIEYVALVSGYACAAGDRGHPVRRRVAPRDADRFMADRGLQAA